MLLDKGHWPRRCHGLQEATGPGRRTPGRNTYYRRVISRRRASRMSRSRGDSLALEMPRDERGLQATPRAAGRRQRMLLGGITFTCRCCRALGARRELLRALLLYFESRVYVNTSCLMAASLTTHYVSIPRLAYRRLNYFSRRLAFSASKPI